MCKYCEGVEPFFEKDITEYIFAKFTVCDDVIQTDLMTGDADVEIYSPIEFCPMCGAFLGEDVPMTPREIEQIDSHTYVYQFWHESYGDGTPRMIPRDTFIWDGERVNLEGYGDWWLLFKHRPRWAGNYD